MSTRQLSARRAALSILTGLVALVSLPTASAGLFDPPPKPSKPSNIHVYAQGVHGANIKWSHPASDVKFLVWRYYPNIGRWVKDTAINDGQRTAYIPRSGGYDKNVDVWVCAYRWNLFGTTYSDWAYYKLTPYNP